MFKRISKILFVFLFALCMSDFYASAEGGTIRKHFRERFGKRIKERIQDRLEKKMPEQKALDYDGPIYSIDVDGGKREFIIHIPKRQQSSVVKDYPAVLFFHGGKSHAEGMDNLSKFNRLADQYGFIVIYPKGIDLRWNDGRGSDMATADDVGFVSALIDHLVKEYHADRRNIFATGISNGAILTHLLACELSDKIKAIAPVAGGMAESVSFQCQPDNPVSVAMFHGTQDPLLPWQGDTGGKHGQIGGKVWGAEETIEFWTNYYQTNKRPNKTRLPNTDKDDGTRVQKWDFGKGKGENQFVLYKIINGGHTWPGGWQYAPERIIGKTTRDIFASDIIWQFFHEVSSFSNSSGQEALVIND